MSDYSTCYVIVSTDEYSLESIKTAANAVGGNYEVYSRDQYIVTATRKKLRMFMLLLQKDYDTITADVGWYTYTFYAKL